MSAKWLYRVAVKVQQVKKKNSYSWVETLNSAPSGNWSWPETPITWGSQYANDLEAEQNDFPNSFCIIKYQGSVYEKKIENGYSGQWW